MRTLGQYMLGSSATFGFARPTSWLWRPTLTAVQLLHVHRHHHPHRILPDPHTGIRRRTGEQRQTSHHEEGVGAEDEAAEWAAGGVGLILRMRAVYRELWRRRERGKGRENPSKALPRQKTCTI